MFSSTRPLYLLNLVLFTQVASLFIFLYNLKLIKLLGWVELRNKYLQRDKNGQYLAIKKERIRKGSLQLNSCKIYRAWGIYFGTPATHFRVENETLAKTQASDNWKKKLVEGISSRESPANGYLKHLSTLHPESMANMWDVILINT